MNNPPAFLFEQCVRERTYLKSVTEPTLIWCRVAIKNYRAVFADDTLPTKSRMQQFVKRRLIARRGCTSPHLRHGVDIVRLSMVMGHTQITTTQRYLHLLTEDLSASHQRVSILNRLG